MCRNIARQNTFKCMFGCYGFWMETTGLQWYERDWKGLFCQHTTVMTTTKHLLQRQKMSFSTTYRFNETFKKYDFTISTGKTRITTFVGKGPMRLKTVIVHVTVKQICILINSEVTYLMIKMQTCKLNFSDFQYMWRTIRIILGNKARRKHNSKVYKIVADPTMDVGY